MSEPEPSALPLFYSAVEPLDKQRHASLGLVRERLNFSFAAQASAVPLNAAEFNFALKSYPIVFTSAAEPRPIAILGLQDGQNLFVNPDGSWRQGAYVPLYVRRYPFIFGTVDAENQFAFCVDTASDMVSENADLPFFDENGELSEAGQKGVETCQIFQQQHTSTGRVMEKLGASGLLERREATVAARSGNERVLGSYVGVNEERLGAVSDEQFLEFRHNDLLPYLYMHLSSLSNWMRLFDLHVQRNLSGEQAQADAGSGTAGPPGP
ncbi:MAG: SapC family protein [Alphaproteobacteria bacterium]